MNYDASSATKTVACIHAAIMTETCDLCLSTGSLKDVQNLQPFCRVEQKDDPQRQIVKYVKEIDYLL
jgi:hypothetical protein